MGADPPVTPGLIVPRRFCGPAVSGNGGWTAGALAALGAASVTPLELANAYRGLANGGVWLPTRTLLDAPSAGPVTFEKSGRT